MQHSFLSLVDEHGHAQPSACLAPISSCLRPFTYYSAYSSATSPPVRPLHHKCYSLSASGLICPISVIIYRYFSRTGFADFLALPQLAWTTAWAGTAAGRCRHGGISCSVMKLVNSC